MTLTFAYRAVCRFLQILAAAAGVNGHGPSASTLRV